MADNNIYICNDRCILRMISFYKRRWQNISLRYPGRDYSMPGIYFVTICTGDKRKWFGTIINAEMQLSDIGRIAYKFWYEIPEHFPDITLDDFIIMPDHIHGIIIINRNMTNHVVGSLHAMNLPTPDDAPGKNVTMSCISPKSGSLSVVIRSYKSAVTRDARLINGDFHGNHGFMIALFVRRDNYPGSGNILGIIP